MGVIGVLRGLTGYFNGVLPHLGSIVAERGIFI